MILVTTSPARGSGLSRTISASGTRFPSLAPILTIVPPNRYLNSDGSADSLISSSTRCAMGDHLRRCASSRPRNSRKRLIIMARRRLGTPCHRRHGRSSARPHRAHPAKNRHENPARYQAPHQPYTMRKLFQTCFRCRRRFHLPTGNRKRWLTNRPHPHPGRHAR